MNLIHSDSFTDLPVLAVLVSPRQSKGVGVCIALCSLQFGKPG